jgi:hypothetical protein
MKKTVLLLASLFVMTLATQGVMAQNSADATANATATIITPISIKKTADLLFGKIVKSDDGGTVVIDTEGNAVYSGVTEFANNINVSAAQFTVKGNAGNTYSILLPTSITISETGGATMTVDNFTSSPDETAGGIIASNGTQTLSVGATLNVGADQTPGEYTGSFDVTVSYN